MEETNESLAENRQVKKGNRLFFIFTICSVLFQIVLTFYLLINKSSNKELTKIILCCAGLYLVVFLLLVLISIKNRKISKDSLGLYKRSMKIIKYFFSIIMIGLSILNIISASGLNFISLFSSIVLLVYNIILICIDIFIFTITDRIRRKKHKKERLKLQNSYGKHESSKKHFGDFSKR